MITGACANENGGCSDSCLSPDGVNVECHCPSGKILSEDRKTCTSQLFIHYKLKKSTYISFGMKTDDRSC